MFIFQEVLSYEETTEVVAEIEAVPQNIELEQEPLAPEPVEQQPIELTPVPQPPVAQLPPPESIYFQDPPLPITEMLGPDNFYFLQVSNFLFR